ncbi:hypothetical protein BGX38DRAFT_1280682 [Terfezia claveryi]|nr:hypothetical protein BGX38DRAFT_1280682 [Terfezia claveryi]
MFIEPPTQRGQINHSQTPGEAHSSPNGYSENPGIHPTPVQAFTLVLGEELELLDAVLEGPLETRLLGLQHQDTEQLTPWLERTGWVSHLGQFPLLPLGLSVTLPNIVQVDTPGWMISVLDRVAEAFTALWVAAEHSLSTEATNSTLVLLKSYKSGSYAHEDIVPFKAPAQQATRDQYRNQWLTYIMFCCRWYLEQVSGSNDLPDEYRIIVAPHLVQLEDLSIRLLTQRLII